MQPRALALPVLLISTVASCNLLTGADDLSTTGGRAGEGGDGSGSTSASTSASTGSTTSTGVGTGGSGAGGGAMGTCDPACAANEYCEAATNTCVCVPGFVRQGDQCVAVPPGDPSTHTQSDVCGQWTTGHQVTDPSPFSGAANDCDPGSLAQAGFVDTLARMNMFRWMVGLGPTWDDATLNQNAQMCANLESWWDWGLPNSPHQPPANVKCYTATGAATAGESNLAWGSGHPAQAIDQYMQDSGNETTMGHRRWILNPPLAPVGIGYWQGGGQYGDAQCLRVFGGEGQGPHPSWYAFPPPGFVPIETAQWTWSFHGSVGGIPGATVSVLRVDDATPLQVQMLPLGQGYAEDATSWNASGWQAEVGKTYRVTVSGLSTGDIVYDVKPVTCN